MQRILLTSTIQRSEIRIPMSHIVTASMDRVNQTHSDLLLNACIGREPRSHPVAIVTTCSTVTMISTTRVGCAMVLTTCQMMKATS